MAGATALSAVHTALYAALQADPVLAGRVYDHVPQDPRFPYLRLRCAEGPLDTHNRSGRIVTALVHIFSTYRGMAEAYGLLDHLVARLDLEALNLATTGWTQMHQGLVYRTGEADEPELVDDLEVQHVLAEFDVLVQARTVGAGSPGS